MGNGASTPAPGAAAPAKPVGCPVDHSKMGGAKPPADAVHAAALHAAASAPAGGGLPATCPVDHGGRASSSANSPASVGASGGAGAMPPSPTAGLPSECPVNHGGASSSSSSSSRARGTVYNVYAQPIDPKNNMPATANQQPAPGQAAPLSTHRVQSSIPKGGTESTWQYPSPQMFWNSLVRKGKAEGAAETDMDMVVAIHNEMNERTWRQLLAWEHGLHRGEHLDGEPSLRRFMGMPYTLSPKAKIKSHLGYGFPFDRHDWFVDRNGREVRYVIDYYFNPNYEAPKAPEAGAADGALPEAPKSYVGVPADALRTPKYTGNITVDVRPAVDDVGSFIDRLRRFPERAVEAWGRPRFVAEGIDPSKAPAEAAALSMLHSSNTLQPSGEGEGAKPSSSKPAADPEAARVQARCKPHLDALASATTEAGRQQAHVALTYCMATSYCPPQAGAFMKVLEAGDAAGEGAEERAFADMSKCVVDRLAASAGVAGKQPGGAALK